MFGRKSIFGISMLCGLAFLGALAATSAYAEQRAFTCAPGGTQFIDAHCKTAGTGFGHVNALAIGVPTEIDMTNANTASETATAQVWKLHGSDAGVQTEIQCAAVSGTGQVTNEATFTEGTGVLHLTECAVTKPANKNCVVKGNKIDTEELFATTKEQEEGQLKVEAVGARLATITIEKCVIGVLNNATALTGSLIANTSGATATTTPAEITAQATLKYAGNTAGLESALTIKMAEGGNAITLT